MSLMLQLGPIAAGVFAVIVIIVCIAYFMGKRSAKKIQDSMNQSQMMQGMPYQQGNGMPQPQMMNGAMQQAANARFCTKCGKQDLDGKAFCAFCGNHF